MIYSIPVLELVGVPVYGLRAQVRKHCDDLEIEAKVRELVQVEIHSRDGVAWVRVSWLPDGSEGGYDCGFSGMTVEHAQASGWTIPVEIREPRDTTYRERREARADRYDEWASKRDVKAGERQAAADAVANTIPFGQPMMPDHHSFKSDRSRRERMRGNWDRAHEHRQTAATFRGRADTIRDQADHAIYSDDPDAAEALNVKIEGLEAERKRINDYNKTCRRGEPDESLLDDRQRADLASLRRVASYQLRKGGQFPAYATANISGQISAARQRLVDLQRMAARAAAHEALVAGRKGRTEW
jgi:uncharacterized protein DUF3560